MGTFLGTHEETKLLNAKHLRTHDFDISSITNYLSDSLIGGERNGDFRDNFIIYL
jgi:hypothetical protein